MRIMHDMRSALAAVSVRDRQSLARLTLRRITAGPDTREQGNDPDRDHQDVQLRESPRIARISMSMARSGQVVLAPPTRMQSRGLQRDMLKIGTRATVLGYVHKNVATELRAERITIADKTTELR